MVFFFVSHRINDSIAWNLTLMSIVIFIALFITKADIYIIKFVFQPQIFYL